MPLETERIHIGDIEEVYSWDVDQEGTRQLVFRINADDEFIEWYPRDEDFPLETITLEGFRRLPEEFAEAGYIKSGVQYHLKRKIEEREIEELTISRTSDTYIRKIPNAGYRVVLPYDAFRDIAARFRGVTTAGQAERRIITDAAFHHLFPNRFSASAVGIRHRLTRLLNNLDESVIEEMNADEIDKIFDFTRSILENRYTRSDRRRALLSAAKVRVDNIALTEIIEKFEELVRDDPVESRWGEFLRKNLFLVESRYIHIIEQLNVVLGGQRNVDFGLVDNAFYLDLFEIKKPSTRLLSEQTNRGNYYWHSEAVKAIVQAEKYYENAVRRATQLAEDIRRQRNLDQIRVVRPRAVVIMGSSQQFDSEAKSEDFRILRTSLRNVEIILYDELLERLRNQLNKIYV